MQSENQFHIDIEQIDGFALRVTFDDPAELTMQTDEPRPLGSDSGPSPTRMLAVAVGNCLASSLYFCATKVHLEAGPMKASVHGYLRRNAEGHLRVDRMEVSIDAPKLESQPGAAARCLAIFEDYCTVTESVRHGIPVSVTVNGKATRAATAG